MPLNIADRVYTLTGPENADIECLCPVCGCAAYVTVSEEEAERLEAGELIQDVLPHRTLVEREQIISQMCPTDQERLMS